MSPSLISAPLASIDRRQGRPDAVPSMHSTLHISTTPADVGLLSAYPTYHTYSSSASPSAFDTPADFLSDQSTFSEQDFRIEDEFYGINFDDGEQEIDANPLMLQDIVLPTTELPTVEAYLPPAQAPNDKATEVTTNSTYFVRSTRSSPPSRHSPKIDTHGQQASIMEPHDGLARNVFTPQTTDPSNDPTRGDFLWSGIPPSTAGQVVGENAMQGISPRVTITPWGSGVERDLATEQEQEDMEYIHGQEPRWSEEIQDYEPSRQDYTSATDTFHSIAMGTSGGAARGAFDAEGFPVSSGRRGIDPDRRKSISEVQVPNFKDLEEQARLQLKKLEVDDWISQARDSTDADTETPIQSHAAEFSPDHKRRTKSTSALPGQFPISDFPPTPQTSRDPKEGHDIEPVSDAASIRENQLKDGETYFNPHATAINDGDRKIMNEPRYWRDGPMYPYATENRSQPATANEASKKFMELADNFSVLSRSATWGTRRRSEPSIADIESINQGGLLKRLSFNSRKEKEKKFGPGGLFKESFNQLTAAIVQRKKSVGNLKRSRSDRGGRGPSETGNMIKREGLSPAASHQRGSSASRIDTSAGRSAGTTGTTTSPKSTLGLIESVKNVGKRSRSHSALETGSAIASLWRQSGGPPLPTLSTPPVEGPPTMPDYKKSAENFHPWDYPKPSEYSDAEGDDDDEDEPAEEGEAEDFEKATPITPNFSGFHEHVMKLYPNMQQNYLVDRIAHQQVVRYKTLLGARVKHSAATAANDCTAGSHCISLGGSATLLEPKGQPRDSEPSNGLQIITDASDADSNPEGALAAESFPPGVPMPPTQNLPAVFECQLCFKVKKFQKPSDWTKHVHEDVQPFTCTYPSCKEPKSFKRKADWVRHENERHRRLGWWTCQVDDCTHKCYRKDNFLQHLVREHKIPEPKQKTKAAAKKARNSDEPIWVMIRNCHHETTARPQDEPCKFCGKVLNSWKKLTVHLAKHMEGISLSVLRLVDQQQVDANTIISPVEPPPVRHSPVTPGEGDRRGSNGSMAHFSNISASISPPVPQMRNFSSPTYQHHNSPNLQMPSQFPPGMFNPNYGFPMAPTGKEVPYNLQAPLPPQQRFIYDNRNGMPYDSLDQMAPHMPTIQARGFSGMEHSPHLEETGFGTVNGANFGPMPQQLGGFNHSYANSIQSLSPDPAAFSGVQRMSGFQNAQSLAPANQALYTTSPHLIPGQGHNFQPRRHSASVRGDGNDFKFPMLEGTNDGSGMGFNPPQMPSQVMGDPSGMGYPNTSGGGGGRYVYQG